MTRHVVRNSLLLVLAVVLGSEPAFAAPKCKGSFDCFLEELWPQAEERGITLAVFTSAFAGVSPDPGILPLTRAQPEYNKPIGQYIEGRVGGGMIARTRQYVRTHADELAALQDKYGVDPEIVVSIWGVESGFGAVRGSRDVIRSLATLAHARYRDDFFRDELLFALQILQEEKMTRGSLVGSWAGALGQPQFLPSSFVRYAVDATGDGRRDIWNSTTDTLGSIANYLKGHGWKAGAPWGFEVALPDGFDFGASRGTFADWQARGLRRADGKAFPAEGNAYLLFPSGARGPAFLVTENYAVIKSYNFSDPYALAVAHLADRARGEKPIAAKWPSDERPPSRDERIRLQRMLAAHGYFVYNFVGHIDFDQRDAIRDLQRAAGVTADGNPSTAVIEMIGAMPAGKLSDRITPAAKNDPARPRMRQPQGMTTAPQ
jgi:membrane-bound lytic murein transglycosylase B